MPFIGHLGFFCFYRWGSFFKLSFLIEAKEGYQLRPQETSLLFTANAPPTPSRTKLTSPCILLIEDTPLIQRLHQEMLVELGCTVDAVGNGREALASIDKAYDLILLDLGLPDINGMEVAQEFYKHYAHQQKPPPRIVALTAHAGSELTATCLEAVVSKPVDLEKLKTIVYSNPTVRSS